MWISFPPELTLGFIKKALIPTLFSRSLAGGQKTKTPAKNPSFAPIARNEGTRRIS